MNVLALDLATKTGYAWNRGDEFACGTWVLGTDKEIRKWGKERLTRTADPRIERLCTRITDLGSFDIVVFEDVQFASSTYAVQMWSSLRASIWLCANATAHVDCVSVGTLKKFATGSGNADKQTMSKCLRVQYPEIWTPDLDDNATDAAWLWLWAKQQFKRMKI